MITICNCLKVRKLDSSVLVIVLVVIGIASAVLLFLSYRIVNETEQLSLEKTSAQAEQIAKTGVERIVQNITEVGNTTDNIIFKNLNNKGFANLSLVDMGICIDDLDTSREEDIPYCSSESKILAYPSFIITDYNLKNDETLEVNIVDSSHIYSPPHPIGGLPVGEEVPDLALIFKRQEAITFVVTAFDSNYTLKGKCVINFKNGMSIGKANLNCEDVSTVSINAIDKDLVTVTADDVVIKVPSTGVSIFRIKALTPGNADGSVYVTITGIEDRQLVNLPTIQEYYLRAGVYTGTGDKTTYYQYNTVVMAHPMVPEVFDWVLFNASDKPIDK